MSKLPLLSALVLMAGAQAVQAQDFSMPGTSPMDLNMVQSAGLTAQISNLSLGDTARSGARRGYGSGARGVYATRGAPVEIGVAMRRLSYQVTPSLSRQALVEYGERARRKNVAAAEASVAELRRHDVSRIYRGIIAPFGLRDGNAADALTAYTVLGWLIATGAGDPPRRNVVALRDQLAGRLASDPRLSGANAAALGEELKISFVTLHAGWQSARREGNLRPYSDGVARLFERQGTDLRALRLTSDGLAAR